MTRRPKSLSTLITYLKKLPGIGERTAERLAFWLLKAPADDVAGLAEAIAQIKEAIRFCSVCGGLTEEESCALCSDPKRDPTVVCVVEDPDDLYAIERTGVFTGHYHVLQGVISPLEGIGPDDLHIGPLEQRCRSGGVREVILATSPTTEGEATALYLARRLAPLGVAVTRIARGVPMGGDLQYADKMTLGKAIEGRTVVQKPDEDRPGPHDEGEG
ncbi:MAG: recombination mediator RecR [Nitrospinota bacterium]